MGWDEDFLRSTVNTCTNLSGEITDCPLFTIQDSSVYGNCNITEPASLVSENVLSPIGSLPGNVAIASGPAYAKPAASPAGTPNPVPAKAVPAPAPAATSSKLPGLVFAATEAESTTTETTAISMTSTVTVAPPPTPTSSVSYYSTGYLTTGQIVHEFFWVEDVVTVTEQVTATVGVRARNHLHQHRRHDHYH